MKECAFGEVKSFFKILNRSVASQLVIKHQKTQNSKAFEGGSLRDGESSY